MDRYPNICNYGRYPTIPQGILAQYSVAFFGGGTKGPTGPSGSIGLTGPSETGPTGPSSTSGKTGNIGISGVIGITGPIPVTSLTGTTNQVTVVNTVGDTYEFSLPQDIHTGASPVFSDTTFSTTNSQINMVKDSSADFGSVRFYNSIDGFSSNSKSQEFFQGEARRQGDIL